MRRIVMALATALAFALAVPGIALAHHRHGTHHSRHRHHRAHGARIVKFTTSDEVKGGEGTGPKEATSAEGVGTVVSFEGGVLKIKLNDGSEVGGKVTEDTRLTCISSTPSTATDDDVGAGDDESGDADSEGSGDDAEDEGSVEGEASAEGDRSDEHGSFSGTDDSSLEGGEDGGDDDQSSVQSCETSALTPGAMVREAELRLTSSGAMWESVVLAH